ncbi:MAG: methyltransferase domain-containing protein [Chloroflexi bacterium]|nr:methyltransferase domain-containing protein [Chloroflexota bacterium]
MQVFALFGFVAALIVGLWIFWRSKHRNLPCPTTLIALLDNPFTRGYHRTVLARLKLEPGFRALDAGCGPGLLTVPIAQTVGPTGRVLALDVQPGMLERARTRVAKAGMTNVDFLLAGLGDGKLPTNTFDRALLVTVLGEVADKLAALKEIYGALKPGGFLSVTEVLPDPDYQSAARVKNLAAQVGFRVRNHFGNFFLFTLNLEKS